MKLRAEYCKLTLNFRFDAGTSRGVLKNKDSFFIKLFDETQPEVFGIGEAGPLFGLSVDFETAYKELKNICQKINNEQISLKELSGSLSTLTAFPSVVFALETALKKRSNSIGFNK